MLIVIFRCELSQVRSVPKFWWPWERNEAAALCLQMRWRHMPPVLWNVTRWEEWPDNLWFTSYSIFQWEQAAAFLERCGSKSSPENLNATNKCFFYILHLEKTKYTSLLPENITSYLYLPVLNAAKPDKLTWGHFLVYSSAWRSTTRKLTSPNSHWSPAALITGTLHCCSGGFTALLRGAFHSFTTHLVI